MKKLLLTAIVVMFALSNVKAQENVIKANPIGLAFGAAQFSYERALNEKSAFELSLAYSSVKANFNSSVGDDTKINGIGAEGKYKLYFSSSNDAPRGWYAAPVIGFSSISGKSGSEEGKVSLFAGGAVAGYQWVFGGGNTGFALDLNLGVQYLNVKTSGDISGITLDGILPRLGLSLGYAW